MERRIIVKHALLREINQEMTRLAVREVHEHSRIQGGNWRMQGFRRSGHGYDKAECQMSIAEFMATQQRYDDE